MNPSMFVRPTVIAAVEHTNLLHAIRRGRDYACADRIPSTLGGLEVEHHPAVVVALVAEQLTGAARVLRAQAQAVGYEDVEEAVVVHVGGDCRIR